MQILLFTSDIVYFFSVPLKIKLNVTCCIFLPAAASGPVLVSPCESVVVCVIMAKSCQGPTDNYCSGNYHRGGTGCSARFLSVCLSVDGYFSHHDNITRAKDQVAKLYRCAADIKMKAEYEDGCGPISNF